MYTTKRILGAAAVAFSVALPFSGFAQETAGHQDVVIDKTGQVVSDTFGGCVRTMWTVDGENCPSGEAPTPAAAAAPEATAPAAASPAEAAVASLKKNDLVVYFPFDKANLTTDAKGTLDKIVEVIGSNSSVVHANVVGYADEMGESDYNVKLSERRAGAVQQYLASKGYVNSEVTEVRGLGETNSKTECADKSGAEKKKCLWQDRRVEIELELQDK
jgi:OOP family OmpA-OmpF porin